MTAPPIAAGRSGVVVGSLGLGGMGIVISAYDPDLDRKVAIEIAPRDEPEIARSRLEIGRTQTRLRAYAWALALREARGLLVDAAPGNVQAVEIDRFLASWAGV